MRRQLLLALCAALALCAIGLAAAGLSGSKPAVRPAAFSATGREAAPAGAVPLPHGTVDINSGDLYELTELPRVGEVIGQAIIDNREAYGPFRYPEDLLSVRGIGEKTLEGFRDMLDLSAP